MASRVLAAFARLLVGTLCVTACSNTAVPTDSDVPVTEDERDITSIRLQWGHASGPVVGYLVLLDRDESGFETYVEVDEPVVIVAGEEGHTVRVAVVAFDADGNYGPISPISDKIVFQSFGATAISEPDDKVVSAKTLPVASARVAARVGKSVPADESSDAPTVAAHRFDFDGDSTADLLWEAPELGFFRVTHFDGETLALFGRAGAGWDRAGLADFDGDGLIDVLWSDEAGNLAFTSTAESLRRAPAVVLTSLGSLRADERVVSTGDFDGDDRSDLVVLDEGRGEYSLWETRVGAASQVTPLPAVDTGWSVADVGDFDGDGRADLVWARPDGLTLWPMDGARALEPIDLGEGIEVVASGDFDGDGVEDIARREPSGDVGIVLMGSEGGVWNGLPPVPADGVAVGAGDFDGDGLGDLLWERDGTAEIWFSEGDGRVESLAAAPLGPEWSLVGSGS